MTPFISYGYKYKQILWLGRTISFLKNEYRKSLGGNVCNVSTIPSPKHLRATRTRRSDFFPVFRTLPGKLLVYFKAGYQSKAFYMVIKVGSTISKFNVQTNSTFHYMQRAPVILSKTQCMIKVCEYENASNVLGWMVLRFPDLSSRERRVYVGISTTDNILEQMLKRHKVITLNFVGNKGRVRITHLNKFLPSRLPFSSHVLSVDTSIISIDNINSVKKKSAFGGCILLHPTWQ